LNPGSFNEAPDILDERFPNEPQSRPATSPDNLPFTGADLTLMVLIGVTTITLGIMLVSRRRRPTDGV
jgi:LPXTG-motif cell wall-anchored protein